MQRALSGSQTGPSPACTGPTQTHRPGSARRCCCPVQAAGGRPANFGSDRANFGGSSGLILPGDSGNRPARGAGRLIIPGQEPQKSGSKSNPFRPPPGFMDDETVQTKEQSSESPQSMLAKLRAQSDSWHKLAACLPQLARAGYDSIAIEADTGVEKIQQNVWTVAVEVYQSLQRSGECSKETLSYFDTEGADVLLYELRFNAGPSRPDAATYIAENQLDTQQARTLARALKDQERREGDKLGFSAKPGDCLAFKYYRDAIEVSRSKTHKEQLLKKAYETAVTDEAREAVKDLERNAPQDPLKQQRTTVHVVKLAGDQTAFRPVPILSSLAEASPSSLTSAPVSRSQGAFNSFLFGQEAAGIPFVMLPAWHSLMLARRPVGLTIPNCADVPAVSGFDANTKPEGKVKMEGEGLLIIDAADKEASDETSIYVVAVSESALGLSSLAELPQESRGSVCGRVLFCCRPPARGIDTDPTVQAGGSNLLQL